MLGRRKSNRREFEQIALPHLDVMYGVAYRLTRNPMYLGMLTVLTGVAVLTGSLAPFLGPVLFVPVLNSRVIRHEEAMLEAQFGDEYRQFKQSVRRWI